MAKDLGEGQPAVARKGPYNARSSGHETDSAGER